MDEQKIRDAIDTIEELRYLMYIIDSSAIPHLTLAIKALEKQLNTNDLISRNELIKRLNNSADRYQGGRCNGVEYKDVETFEVDEVYEIIDRVWEGIPEDRGE